MNKVEIAIGDIIQLGRNQLACGDCRDAPLVKRLLGTERINAVICDPPYGINYTQSKRELTGSDKHVDIANDHLQSSDEYRAFTRAWLEATKPVLAKKNTLYCFNSDKLIFALRDGMQDAGFHFGQLLIWVKHAAVISRLDYLCMHELIAVGWYGTHERLRTKDKSVIAYPKPSKSPLHPTMKPVGLMRRLILNSTKINDIVYDPFLGSGSTLIAAEETRRRCYGIELSVDYCQVIIDRFEKMTGIKAEKISSPSRI